MSTTCHNHECPDHETCNHNIHRDGMRKDGSCPDGQYYMSAKQSIWTEYTKKCEKMAQNQCPITSILNIRSVVEMAERIYICRKVNPCPVGNGLYRCCATCNEPCDDRLVCSRSNCDGLVPDEHRDLLDVNMDDMARVLHAVIEELGDIPSNSELDYSWKENFVHGLDVPEKLKKKLVSPRRRNW